MAVGVRRGAGGLPMLGGPSNVAVTREDRAEFIVCAPPMTAMRPAMASCTNARSACRRRHALRGRGYVPCRRRQRAIARRQDRFAVRFHLHPSVKATRLSDGQGVMLIMPTRRCGPSPRATVGSNSKNWSISPAPARAAPRNRHPRPRRREAARAVDFQQSTRRAGHRRYRHAGCVKRNRGCRCERLRIFASPAHGDGEAKAAP